MTNQPLTVQHSTHRRSRRLIGAIGTLLLTLATVANAEEDALVEASLYRGAKRVLRQRSSVDAYRSRIVRFSTRFRPGRYTLRVTLRASMNPARSKSFAAPLRITR